MSKVKVYKGIACLEMQSKEGPRWWYQPETLAFTPIPIKMIRRLMWGRVTSTGREVLAAEMKIDRKITKVALNIPRTDVQGLKDAGLVPPGFNLPEPTTKYATPPDGPNTSPPDDGKGGILV